MKYINTNGKRNENRLTYEQRKECLEYIELLGFEYDISFSEFSNTAFVCSSEGEQYCRLIVGTDVYPNNSAHTPNEIISYKGAIAHEIIGHYEAWIGNFECENRYIDEAQASIRAARFAPLLTIDERIALLKDGLTRLKEGSIKLINAKKIMHIEKR